MTAHISDWIVRFAQGDVTDLREGVTQLRDDIAKRRIRRRLTLRFFIGYETKI